MSTDRTEYGIYSQIASGEGIRARDIAKELHIDRKTVSPAVGFSMWWVYASVFLGALGMMVYYVVNVCKSIRRLRTL